MVTTVNPLYNTLLGVNLNSTVDELKVGHAEIDFSLTERTWKDTARSVALLLLKIVLFPWALYEAIRWSFQRMVMTVLYPAQSWIVKHCFSKRFTTYRLDQDRVALHQFQDRFIIRHVTLEKDGTRFSGLLVGKPDTINNGKWILQVGGNCATAEGDFHFANRYLQDLDYNTLLVNNPGVGRSEGFATPATIGECQRTAITYLKTALKAERLVLAGYSLGGGGIGEAIDQYDFENNDIEILVVRQMTFAKASEMGAKIGGCIAKNLALWTGCEMDNTKSSEKLDQYKINEIIIQGGDDEVIPFDYSLAKSQLGGLILPGVTHMDSNRVIEATISQISIWDRALDGPIIVAL